MPSSLHNRLSDLASSFASSLIGVIRSASLQELLAESTRGGAPPASGGPVAEPKVGRRRRGRLARRSAGHIAQVIEKIAGLLKQHPRGLRAEQIRKKLGLHAKELPRPLKEALESGRLSKSGQKRATTYSLKSASISKGVEPRKATTKGATARAATRRSRRAGKRGRPSKLAPSKPVKATAVRRANAKAAKAAPAAAPSAAPAAASTPAP
jgi:hypothetical protein